MKSRRLGQAKRRLNTPQVVLGGLPPACAGIDDPNDHSVVMRLSMGEISFLLTGDVEAGVEQRLAAGNFDLRSTVLKSAHHGSNSSSTPQLLEVVNPQVVVISVGADNNFGHPSAEVLNRLSQNNIPLFRTDEIGDIVITSSGDVLFVNGVPVPSGVIYRVVSNPIQSGKQILFESTYNILGQRLGRPSRNQIAIEIRQGRKILRIK